MEQQTIWNYFQGDEGESSFSGSIPRYRYLAKKIQRGKRVLNIGVGRGGLEKLLLDTGAEVYCLDPSEKAIDLIRSKFTLGENAKVGFSQQIPFDENSFEYVVMTEVLEHLDDSVLSATMSEVRRVLVAGGKFIGTVPAHENLLSNQVICPCCGLVFHRWGHVQSFTSVSLKEVLEVNYFNLVKVRFKAFPDWQRSGVINFFKSFLRWVLGIFGYTLAMPNLYFEASK